MENYLDILRHEFSAGEASFLLTLRCDLEWDKEAFSRLIRAMQTCCETYSRAETIERWVAEGFWYVSDFVPAHASHPNFRRPYSKEYYGTAFQRLQDLAYWFFMDESPYLPGHVFELL